MPWYIEWISFQRSKEPQNSKILYSKSTGWSYFSSYFILFISVYSISRWFLLLYNDIPVLANKNVKNIVH